MQACLVSLDYQSPSSDTTLRDLPVVIGSSPDAGIFVNDQSVSPYHCRLDWIDGQYVVFDLGSVHGTFVNGQRIAESPLLPGYTLTIGSREFFLQVLEEVQETSPSLEERVFFAGQPQRSSPLVHVPA